MTEEPGFVDLVTSAVEVAFAKKGLPKPEFIYGCADDILISGYGIIRPDEKYELYKFYEDTPGWLASFDTPELLAEFLANSLSTNSQSL